MIKEIDLKDFRIFDHISFQTNNSLVIFSGPNATGKTSVLEAIYLMSTSKSHRTNELNSLIKNNKDYAVCEIKENKNYKMIISKEGKALFINKNEIKKTSDFIGNLNVVMFSPSDLSLILGSKGDKRHFLDLELSLIDKAYLKYSNLYKKALKERNEVLKGTQIDFTYLDILTKELIKYLELVLIKRISFIKELNLILENICIDMDIEKIRLEYNKSYGEDLYKSFKGKEKVDLLNKTTTIGLHRDNFTIYLDDHDAKEFASNGQARTIGIALKLALREYITKISGFEPVLLLDDVFAALDKKRIENLTKYVKNNHQTFITTTSILEIPDELLKNAIIIRLDNKNKGEKDNGRE